MKLNSAVIGFILVSLLMVQCDIPSDSTDSAVITKFLGHRGGSFETKSVFPLRENTLPTIIQGFEHFDGVEVDVQQSAEGTVWLFHDGMYQYLGDTFCIPTATDSFIEKSTFNSKFHPLTKLEQIFEYLQANRLDKTISIDVKGYFDKTCFPMKNANHTYLTNLADSIVSLTQKYGLQNYVLVETDYQNVLDQIKFRDKRIKCFLLGYDQFSKRIKKTIDKGYDGVSHNISDPELSEVTIRAARTQGLQIQLWTPNDSGTLIKAFKMNPDFIQTDELNAKFITEFVTNHN